MSERPFSRHTNCRVTDALVYKGLRIVVMENELVSVAILPEKGAEIVAFRYKPIDIDPLLHLPGMLRPPSPFPATIHSKDGPFIDFYRGGWQEIFPSGGGPCNLAGAEFGRHGEAALLPWEWEILEDCSKKVAVRFSVRMVRTPFTLDRVMSLDTNQSFIKLEETVWNTSLEECPFMWGHHIAFGEPFLSSSCSLQVPAKTVEVHQGTLIPANRLLPGSKGQWPILDGVDGCPVDLRQLPAPGCGSKDMLYFSDLNEGWFAITNSDLGLGFGCVWDINVFPYLWMWSEFCGSSGYPWYSSINALSLEPFTSYAIEEESGLAEVIKAGREKRLKGGEKMFFQLSAGLFGLEGLQEVFTISPNGKVLLR